VPSPTQRAAALAEQLLARHGVLTRDAVAGEDVPGGFAALYPVLTALEEAGRIRRGYFVAGLGGSQFADAGALERLRALRETAAAADEEEAVLPAAVLASTDPANAFGAALPWPRFEAMTPMRSAGTHVVLVNGRMTAYLSRGQGCLTLALPEDEPDRSAAARATAHALGRWARATGRPTFGWSPAPDSPPLAHTPVGPFLSEAGLVAQGPGARLADTAAPHGTRRIAAPSGGRA